MIFNSHPFTVEYKRVSTDNYEVSVTGKPGFSFYSWYRELSNFDELRFEILRNAARKYNLNEADYYSTTQISDRPNYVKILLIHKESVS